MKQSYAAYILSTFRQVYDVPDSVKIAYGKQEQGVCIKDSVGNFFDTRQPLDTSRVTWKKWKGVNLPFLFDSLNEEDFFEISDNHLTINYDLIASSFYLLSGWHEFVSDERDVHGRFPYHASIQNKLDVVKLPVVNYYFDILKEAVEQHYEISLSFRAGSAFPFYIAVTHDIDMLYSGWLEEGFAALKKRRWTTALKIMADKVSGRDIWDNLDTLLEFERRHNITASYYFLPSRETSHIIPHADYSVSDEAITRYMTAITKAGSEIGIHAPFGSHLESNSLEHFISRFDPEVSGGRFHYLGFESGKTPGVLEQAGLLYDSSLGFAEHIGFRNSFAHPFHLFDLKKGQPTSVLEVPLVVMDQTLSQKKYMGLSPKEAADHVYPLLEEVKKFNGGVAILWHNNFFSEIKFEGWDKVLSEVVSYGKQHDAGIGSVRALLEHFGKVKP